MALPEIRPMTPADVDAATEAVLRADWGDRREWFAFATTQAACAPFVAVATDGTVVGTGVATANGPVGWVGTIWVAPESRGLGLGRALTQAVIDALEAAGCWTLLLVATDAGRPLYEAMGFRVATHYRILEAPALPETAGVAPDPAVRAYAASDLDAILALDRAASGEDRSHALRRFLSPGSARVLTGPDGTVAGFSARAPWGGGATIAPEAEVARRLLDARRRSPGPSGRVRAGLVEENAGGIAALEAAGYRSIWSAPRLARGEPLDWRPEWIWGQFNHAMG